MSSSLDVEIAKTQEARKRSEQELGSLSTVIYDVDLYGDNKRDSYLHSIPVNDDEEIADAMENQLASKLASYTAPKSVLEEMLRVGGADVGDVFRKPQRITDRENDYQRRRLDQVISPDRNDAFAMGDKTPGVNVRTYVEIMREQALKRREEETIIAISKKMTEVQTSKKRRNRWDETADQGGAVKKSRSLSDWDLPDSTPFGGIDLPTPTPSQLNLRGSVARQQYSLMKTQKDIEKRNMPLSDEELDAMFPTRGYKIMECPAWYVPIRTPARKLVGATLSTPLGSPLYEIPVEDRWQQFDVRKETANGLPFMKPEDYQYFGVLLNEEFQDNTKLTRKGKKSRSKLKRK